MGTKTPALPATGGGMGNTPARAGSTDVQSPDVPPGVQLSHQERQVWNYICTVLREEGLPHRAAGLAIVIVCKTFMQYVRTEIELQNFIASNGGSILQRSSKSDYSQPHPLYYAARDIKSELLKWLPEACLSLPSAVVAKAKLGEQGQQDDLFSELLEHARAGQSAALRPAVPESMSSG